MSDYTKNLLRSALLPLLVVAALVALPALAPSAVAAGISYLGSTTYTSGGGNVTSFTLTRPASTLVTDVLITQLTVKGAAVTVTQPAGWVQVLSTASPGTSLTQYIYYKIATDTEPASYTWTISAARVVAGGLTACRGVTNATAALVDASGAQTQSSVNGSITAPSITTTVANTMLLAFFGGAANTTITANTPLTNEYSLSNGGQSIADSTGYQSLASAGATGTRTATVRKGAKLSGSGNAVGQMVALTPSSVDHFVIEAVGGGTLPAETQKSPFNIQIRAVDASGATVTSYGGKVTISSTGTLSAGSGTTGTFVNGILSPWSLACSNFGSFTITATDYTIPSITGSGAVTVSPILDHFTVEAAAGGSIPNQTTGAPFSILITARDSANGTLSGFTGTVNITSTGTLSAGGGTTPPFTGGVLTRSVTIDNAGSWTITATRTGGTETGTSNTFSVGAIGDFNVFESSLPAGTVSGYLATKIAGVPFGFDVVAVNTSTNTVNTSFNDSVKVEALGSTKTGIAVGANGCPTNAADYSVIQTVSPAFITNGRSTVNFAAVADVWRETRVRITYPASGTPTTVVCSDDVFAIRPDHLTVIVSDADWQTAGTSRLLTNTATTGGAAHKAGRPFTITVTAYNGAATPAVTGNYTVNYAPTPTVKSLACQLPAGCVNGTFTPGTWTVAGPGIVQTTTATYNEAGTFTLALQDLIFASDDAGDPVTPAVYPILQGGGAAGVGRFVPDHFVLTASSIPVFKTFNTTDAGCSTPIAPDTARSFTFIGQPFGYDTPPQILVTAQNASNGATANYSGTLWKINPATDVAQSYVNTPNPPVPGATLSSSLSAPTVTASSGGTGTVTASSADLLTFTRTPTTPQGSFNADLSLTMNVQDSSESGVSGNGTITSTGTVTFNGSSGTGIDFDSGDLFIFGQMNVNPSPNPGPVGPATSNLTVPIWDEWYDDVDYSPAQFAVIGNDYCTSYTASNVTLGSYTGNLVTGDTSPNGSGVMNQGQYATGSPLYLGAPKSAHDGTVTVTYAPPSWLLYNGGTTSVVATFLHAPTVTKSFAAASILPNGSTKLTVTLTNPNSTAVTGAAFTDTYPSGLINTSSAGGATTCSGGTVTAANSGASLSLGGGTIPANGSCTVTVNVTSSAAWSYANSTGPVTTTNAGTGAAASATLVVMAAPTVAQSFSPASVKVAAPSTVTITLTNSNPLPVTGAAFTDTLPTSTGQMAFAATPNLTNSCGGTASIAGNGKSFSLVGGTIPANGSCTVTVDVTVPTQGTYTNSSGSVSTTNAGTGGAATATLTASLLAPPTVAASFDKASVLPNGTAVLTVTLTNPNSTNIIGTAFTDTYPSGLVNATPAGGTTTCTGGTVAATNNGVSLALSGATIPANGICTVTVTVTSATAGSYPTATGNVTTTNAGFGASAGATLVVMAPPTVTKAFSPASVLINTQSTLTIVLTNSNSLGITGAAFTDTYPSGLVNTASAGGATTCPGGTVSAANNGSSLALSGGTIPANGSCTVTVSVTSATAGSYTNATGQVSTANAGTGASASAFLTVTPLPSLLIVTSADKVSAAPGQIITYTAQVTNSGGAATTVVLTGGLSLYQAWGLNSFGAGTPFKFIDGSPSSGLSLGVPSFSNNNGSTYLYPPVSGGGGAAAGYDGAVTNWQLPMTGTMNANSSFSIQYQTIVK